MHTHSPFRSLSGGSRSTPTHRWSRWGEASLVCADSRPLSVQFVRYECVIPGAELVSFGRVDGVRPRLCETGGRAVRFSPESAVNFLGALCVQCSEGLRFPARSAVASPKHGRCAYPRCAPPRAPMRVMERASTLQAGLCNVGTLHECAYARARTNARADTQVGLGAVQRRR
jgi:hypothetical protein